MATYVNNLRLKEIATGDESGTWGASTNTNLELIGEALGYNTQNCFSSDADATTTVADGATDPARAFYFKVTSSATLTTTRTLTIAPNTLSRVMYIENATTGSQSINISQGSGANVTIPTGETRVVYLDGAGSGAAVVDANSKLPIGGVTSVGGTGTVNGISLSGTITSTGSLTLGGTLSGVDLTSQVTGTLPIANGGTGTTSTTFANLATNVTGTLPIANGGTGSTSTTFANLTSNVTGTLPIANGGTGLTSVGTANQVLAVNSGASALEFQTISTATPVGAISDGSAVATSSTSGYPVISSSAVDYDTAISSANGDFFVGVEGQAMSPFNEDSGARARGFGGITWSNYWQRWFATTLDTSGSITANNCRLVQSVDGVNWSDVGRLSTLGGVTVDKFMQEDLMAPNFCFDDSNGRLFVASYESSSPYRLTVGYVDLGTDNTGTQIFSSSTSGANGQGHICDWKWVQGLQKIIGTWYNRTGYFNTFSISAGASSLTLVHTNVSHSSGSNKRMQIYSTQTSSTNFKFYIQNDSTQFWYYEGTDFGGSLTQSTKSDQWNESYKGDMSASVLVRPNGSQVYYVSTANDDWKNNSGWSSGTIPTNAGLSYCKYDPVKNDWLGWSNNGYVLRSTDGITWTIVGSTSQLNETKGRVDRKSTDSYGY